jgi:hypothetical protein
MRRLVSITAFALFLAVPLWGQRGGGRSGGHGGFSGHGGGFGGHTGFSGGRHFSGGMHSGFSRGFTHSSHRTFSRGPFVHNGFHRGFRTHGFRNNCSGFGCRSRFAYAYPWGVGYYDPWVWNWWDSGAPYDEDYERDRALANEMNRQSLEEQRMLRQEEAEDDRDAHDSRSPRSRSNAESDDDRKPAPLISPTLLVFRDRHQEEIRNYAIVGSILWSFAPQHTQRISLADIDLAATMRVNDDRGVTFRVPEASEAR